MLPLQRSGEEKRGNRKAEQSRKQSEVRSGGAEKRIEENLSTCFIAYDRNSFLHYVGRAEL
jgi:hypothetical protein